LSPDLPGPLRGAIEARLEGVSRRDLAERAARVSAAYRGGGGSAGVVLTPDDALAYALARLPATYAADMAVFSALAEACPDFSPATLLDAGAGPGTASWAALEVWPQIEAALLLDESGPFLDLARILGEAGPPVLAGAERRRANLTAAQAQAWPTADLVVASYVLAEIPVPAQAPLVERLWAACEEVLVLVEPGTPAGYQRILAARTQLIEAGARLAGPCPHAQACPLTQPDWCHFVQRLPRSRDHRLAKGAEIPFEDEKFIWLAATRDSVAVTPFEARVLSPPRQAKPGIDLKLCVDTGALEQRFVPRRDKPAYAVVRRLDWGDAI
jgi:ribosomal protein RSM22 (predicted rRNA methylase)